MAFKHEAKPVSYAGVDFKSTLEARWAVFFDACGANWLYEPERCRIDGYKIDFVVIKVALYHGLYSEDQMLIGDFFFEVKGQPERAKSLEKTKRFIGQQFGRDDYYLRARPTLVLNNVPFGGTIDMLMDDAKRLREQWINDSKPYWPEGDVFPYSTTTFTLDDTCAIPCISTDGELMIAYCGCTDHVDVERTIAAYGIAWNAKFGSDGLTPDIVRQMMHNKMGEVRPKVMLKNNPANRRVPKEYTIAVEKFGRLVPSRRRFLSRLVFGGFDGSTVTLLYDRSERMIIQLLDENIYEMRQAFSEAYSKPVQIRMQDMYHITRQTPCMRTARSVIEQSYDVFGRDKIELDE